eukprot:TRINITY_DN48256_c0_g1_i1.p1 TRINITY_DN48256_c0_g1~~TRINITY_DN48256_c0_g1_i1.p1  ORF type:complete len:607 (-),score=54.41 TRINITY_DN48256_c0_g1_i1:120-1940(-)
MKRLAQVKCLLQPPSLPYAFQEIQDVIDATPESCAEADEACKDYLFQLSVYYLGFWTGMQGVLTAWVMAGTLGLTDEFPSWFAIGGALAQLSSSISMWLICRKLPRRYRCAPITVIPYAVSMLSLACRDPSMRHLFLMLFDPPAAEAQRDNVASLGNPDWFLITVAVCLSAFYNGSVANTSKSLWCSFAVYSAYMAWQLAGGLALLGSVSSHSALFPVWLGGWWFLHAQSWQERSTRMLIFTSACLKSTLVRERVLKCQADFKLSPLGMNNYADSENFQNSNLSDAVHTHKTVLTAPAMLSLHEGRLQCTSGDCIPESCHVLLEGSADTVAASSLRAGDRLLCRDALTEDLKYIPIQELHFEEPTIQTCRIITLKDGTSMVMTADHPVSARRSSSLYECYMPAGDLVPKEHLIKCYRQVELEVQSNELSVDRHRRLVSVTVEHGQRYHILAADSNAASTVAGALPKTLPVGSADAVMLDLKTWSLPATLNEQGLRRSQSDSGIVGQWTYEEPPSQTFSHGDSAELSSHSGSLNRISVGTKKHAKGIWTESNPGGCIPCKFQARSTGCYAGVACPMCHSPDHDNLSYGQRNRLQRSIARGGHGEPRD